MDTLDVALIRSLGVVPFLEGVRPRATVGPAALAKAHGVSVETVRRRLTALREAGVLGRTIWWPNPLHFGLRLTSVHVAAGPDPAGRPGIVCSIGMVGGARCIDVIHRDDAELARLAGTEGAVLLDYPLPSPTRPLTGLDRRIIAALRYLDPADVADTVGVHSRTIKRRVDAMVANGDLDHTVAFDPGALDGSLGYVFVDFVAGADARERRRVREAIGGWIAQWSPPQHGAAHLASIVVATPRELEALRQEVASISTVARAEVYIVHQGWADSGWIDDALSETPHAMPDALNPPGRP